MAFNEQARGPEMIEAHTGWPHNAEMIPPEHTQITDALQTLRDAIRSGRMCRTNALQLGKEILEFATGRTLTVAELISHKKEA